MIGRRCYSEEEFGQPGDYMKWHGQWLLCLPTGIRGAIDDRWNITEHPDGTITVSPSIDTKSHISELSWHGYLENGVWRTC
jgi:hypothetical protein